MSTAKGGSQMDAELVLAALGTLFGGLGAGVAWRQLRLQAHDDVSSDDSPTVDIVGVSIAPPTGRVPRRVRGRDPILNELFRVLRRPRGRFVVLAGMGGVGKSTIAAALAAGARRTRIAAWRETSVWWVSVADPAGLTGAMVSLARHLGATDADLHSIALDRPDGADRLWALLEGRRRRWLLVLDNADDPEILVASGQQAGVGDGNGWVRPSRRGLVVVTSRDSSATTWGRHADVVNVELLDESDAAQVLLDWAPDAGSLGEARSLARRLGRLPLALGLAGSYLDSEMALTTSFGDYRRRLDAGADAHRLLSGEPHASGDPRSTVMRTWEVSLDALADRGVPQARVLLRLLSCYAVSTPIPLDLLDPLRLIDLLSPTCGTTDATAEADLEVGLQNLRRLRMIDARSPGSGGGRALAIHPLIADTSRAHLTTSAVDHSIDPSSVRRTAVELAVEYLAGLDYDSPVDWSRYRLLAPHLHALFETAVTDLDEVHLRALVTTATTAASAHDRAGAFTAAWRLSRAALAVLPVLDRDDPACLLARHNYAWELAMHGSPAEAKNIYQDVHEGRVRALGSSHPDTLNTRNELAWVTAIQGEPGEAEAIYRQVLHEREALLGNDHPETLLSRHELAWAIASQGRGAEAEEILYTVIEARTRILGRHHPRTLQSHHELAWAIARQNRWIEAQARYEALLATRTQVLGADHPETLTTAHELAWSIAMQGRRQEAIGRYKDVLTTRTHVLGVNHPATLDTEKAYDRLLSGKTTPAKHQP